MSRYAADRRRSRHSACRHYKEPLATRSLAPTRRAVFEILEERAMLTVAQDLQNLIAPYQSAVNTALSVATSLPLVGHQLTSLQDLSTLLQNSLQTIESAVQGDVSGHFQVAIPLGTLSHTFTFNLGLDAFLQVSTAGGVTASISPVLNVGFDIQNSTVSLDKAHTNLDIGFSLSLPNFQASASFNHVLYTHIVDQGTTFDGHLKFGFDENNDVSPSFSGDAHIRFGLTLSFVDPALHVSFNPTFLAQLQLDWGIDSTSNQLKIPQIALKNFGLDADSFMHNFLGDIVTSVQKYTKPIQPFLDMFDTPVPILSAFDSSETMGDLFLSSAGLSADQQASFKTMVRVIRAVNTFDLTGSTGGAVISFGDINLTGNAQLAGAFNFDTSQLPDVVNQIFNTPALQEVEGVLKDVASYVNDTASAGFQFPLLEHPGTVIGGILTGQTETMFSFSTGRQHFELAPSIGFGIKDLFGVFLTAGIIFDADLTMGYDTAGLNKLINDPTHDPADLLHGFYFDNSVDTSAPPIPNVSSPKKTGLYLQGFAEVSGSVIATLSGGLYANVVIEVASNDNSPHVALDSIIQNLNSHSKAFNASGKLYASAQIELTLDTEVGPKITLFSFNLGRQELLNYDPPPALTSTIPIVVIDVADQHTLKLDPSKMSPGSVVTVQPFHDQTINSGGTFAGDGIRVDYPNEIDLYIERKNDVNTNFYNLIGVNGVVPDGVTLNIADPFRVFADEGVSNPAPAQTTPAVVLAGGKNVNYDYTEVSDGSHAHVLLAGGYGSNTLTGGTIEFGNFIPAGRINQAKQHFGDQSGFDATGVALINSSIDAAVAPADPAGVIGATMTASHGGLMLGGAGNNSFIATGPGAYEMLGGPWVNTFNISPSFNGVPATYAIDGGPYGQSQLIVRIPAGDLADFENGTVPDKYDPASKALDIYSNAGLFATAHGIHIVQTSSVPGSTVVVGDTSELNIQFKLKGSGTIKFGGSNAPDAFSVSSIYQPRSVQGASWEELVFPTTFYGTKDRHAALLLRPWPARVSDLEAHGGFDALFQRLVKYGPVNTQDQIGQWAWVSPKLPESQWPYLTAVPPGANNGGGAYHFINALEDYWYPIADYGSNGDIFTQLFPAPTFTIGRTFGTNGKTQNITFELGDAASTNMILDGRGASDNYDVSLGLGSFIDVTVDDSDETTQNSLTVHYGGSAALGQRVELTDTSLKVEYATPLSPRTFDNGNGIYYYTSFGSSVSYAPTVNFDANTDITFRTGDQFRDTIVNRPNAPQKATLQFVNAFRPSGYIYDVQVANPQLQIIDGSTPSEVDTVANGGNFVVEVIDDHGYVEQYTPTVNIQGNTGTVDLHFSQDTFALGPATLNVYGNSGTVKLDSNRYANRGGNFNVNVVGNNGLVSIGSTATSGSRTFNINATSTTGQVKAELAGFTGLLTFNVLANASDLLVQATNTNNTFTVFSNTGALSVSETQRWTGAFETFNVLGNAGTLNIDTLINATDGAFGIYVQGLARVVNVLANAGTINLNSVVASNLINYGIESQVNIGSQGSLANVHGPINLSNTNGHYGLKIDDRTNPGSGASWSVDYDKTTIGDLTINYPSVNAPAPYSDIFSKYEAFPKASSILTLVQDPPFFYKNYSGGPFPALTLSAPYARYDTDGTAVEEPVSATGPAGSTLTFAASNLPSGLSIDPSTGLISGTIAPGAWAASPYDTIITVGAGQFRRGARIFWNVASGIAITVDDSNLSHFEGQPGSATISATNAFNRPVVFTVTGLPPGIAFDANTSTLSGTISPGAAASGPYNVNIHATDGFETADYLLSWVISGITLNTPANQVNFVGESVHLAFQGSTVSGAPLMYSADGLPDGLSINASTGVISGVPTAAAAVTRVFYASITATSGNDSAQVHFSWSVLPVGISDYISPVNPGLQNSREGESGYIGLYASSSLYLPLTYTVTGLPPGLSVFNGDWNNYIYGTFSADAVSGSPYHVEITATDGRWSNTVSFDWVVRPPGTVDVQEYGPPTSFVNDTISDFQVYAESQLGETLTFSATGLPPGLSINAQTGLISGTILPAAAIPSVFQTSVTATSASDSDTWSFLWTVLSSYQTYYQPNVVTLPNPSGVGTFEIMSPEGTTLSASISPHAGVGLPANVEFPYGFLAFTISGLQPGQAADLTISGLNDTSLITNYYKYGPTPANSSSHWYQFLYNQQTDADSAAGTGESILSGGTIVLHLVDGGRGDDDVARNGVITDLGGPAITVVGTDPLSVTNTNDSGAGSLRQAIINANNSPGVTHTITFALPSGPQTINLQSPLPATADPLVAVLDATQNVTVLSSGASYGNFIKTGAGTLEMREIAHVGGGLQISGGRLRLRGGSPPTFGSGTTASITGSGALELAGTISSLTRSINVTNGSSATAGLIVSGQNQVVGGIEGGGNVSISDGGGLTANHIIAGTLDIGSGGVFTLAPSDASGNPLVVSSFSSASPGGPAMSSVATRSANLSPVIPAASTVDDSEPVVSSTSATVATGTISSVVNEPTGAAKSQAISMDGDWLVSPRLGALRGAVADSLLALQSFKTSDELWTASPAITSELADAVFENHWLGSRAAEGESSPTGDSWTHWFLDGDPLDCLVGNGNRA